MGIAERKERERQERREAILAAAESIFFNEPADKGTMDDVADKVELSKGTLYLYFKNKTDLQYALAEKGVGLLAGLFKTVVKPDLNGREQLSDIGDEFVRFVELYPKYFELILRFEITQPQPLDCLQKTMLMNPAFEVLQEILSKGQADGTIRNDLSVNEIVIILWSQMLGLMQSILRKERYIDYYGVDIKRVIKGHYRIIMKGMLPG